MIDNSFFNKSFMTANPVQSRLVVPQYCWNLTLSLTPTLTLNLITNTNPNAEP